MTSLQQLFVLILCTSIAFAKEKSGPDPNSRIGCCALAWTEVDSETYELPKDVVTAGHLLGQVYGFYWTDEQGIAGIKASDTSSFGFDFEPWNKRSTGMKLLRNPSKCKLGWYPIADLKKANFSKIESAKDWHFIRSNFAAEDKEQYFSRTEGKKYWKGVFYPGFYDAKIGSNFYFEKTVWSNLTQSKEADFELLYVDCAAQDYGAKLIAVKFDEQEFEKLSAGRVFYSNQSLTNKESIKKESSYQIQAKTVDKVNLLVPKFPIKNWQTYKSVNLTLQRLTKKLAVDMQEVVAQLSFNGSSVLERTKEWNQKVPISLAPKSVANIFIYTKPYRGSIELTMIFEVKFKKIFDALKYLYQELKLDKTIAVEIRNNKVRVEFIGQLNVDAGHFIVADVERSKL